MKSMKEKKSMKRDIAIRWYVRSSTRGLYTKNYVERGELGVSQDGDGSKYVRKEESQARQRSFLKYRYVNEHGFV